MIFVDSSGFVSLASPKDEFHRKATSWWKINRNGLRLVTSNLVIIETLGWVRHNLGKRQAVGLGNYILMGEGIKIVRSTNVDETRAWKMFKKMDDRGVSMVDCVSGVIMKKMGIKRVFTFDEDFTRLGFEVVPG